MRRWILAVGLPGLFLLASSCAPSSAMEDTNPYDASERDAHAEVQNDHQLDGSVIELTVRNFLSTSSVRIR